MPYETIVLTDDPRLLDVDPTAWTKVVAQLKDQGIACYTLADVPDGPAANTTLMVGLTKKDARIAQARGWVFALALWGGELEGSYVRTLYRPEDLLAYVTQTNLTEPWLTWAMELQSLAQCGLAYTENAFDRERFERIREIAAEMLSHQTDIPKQKMDAMFCNEVGYQTPKIDTRAAVVQEGKILLVQEQNGLWALPGGWVDVLESVKSNTEKEAREEAGAEVVARRIVALHDRRKNNPFPSGFGIIKVFVLCDLLSFDFKPNLETLKAQFFSRDALPELAVRKTTAAQIDLCLKAALDPDWQVVFD